MKFALTIKAAKKSGVYIIAADSPEEAGGVANAFIDEHWPKEEHPIRAASIEVAPEDAEVSTGVQQ